MWVLGTEPSSSVRAVHTLTTELSFQSLLQRPNRIKKKNQTRAPEDGSCVVPHSCQGLCACESGDLRDYLTSYQHRELRHRELGQLFEVTG